MSHCATMFDQASLDHAIILSLLWIRAKHISWSSHLLAPIHSCCAHLKNNLSVLLLCRKQTSCGLPSLCLAADTNRIQNGHKTVHAAQQDQISNHQAAIRFEEVVMLRVKNASTVFIVHNSQMQSCNKQLAMTLFLAKVGPVFSPGTG